MWIWDFQLKQMGFRQMSDRYWQCERGFGLAEGDHISLFLWTRDASTSSQSAAPAYELTEFHVTFLIDRDHIHFYYHEIRESAWQPGGHTSSIQLRSLGYHPPDLISEADAIAQALIARLDGMWISRDFDLTEETA